MLGGVALIVFGAGLNASKSIRRYISQLGVGKLAQALMPDVERYFRLRAIDNGAAAKDRSIDESQMKDP